jgi:hypothetical protein
MAKSRKVCAIHPGEILKTEFMEPMGVSSYALVKAIAFPGIYEVVRGDRHHHSLAEVLCSARAVLAQPSD